MKRRLESYHRIDPTFARNPISEEPLGNEHTGFHSSIRKGITDTGQPYLVKRYGYKKGLKPTEAEELMGHMEGFRATARAGNMPLPVVDAFAYALEPHRHPGKATLAEFVPMLEGPDLGKVFADSSISDDRIMSDLKGYLKLYQMARLNGRVSLDPPPANFGRIGITETEKDNQIVYFDVMPPRYMHAKGIISEWPTPPNESREFIETRNFDPNRQILVIYAQLLRSIQDSTISPSMIRSAIKEILGSEAEAAISLTDRDKALLLANPGREDVDLLRIIAGEGYHDGSYNRAQLKAVFGLTHIEPGGILPPQVDIHEAVDILQHGRYDFVAVS